MLAKESSAAAAATFDLPEEVLEVLPADPFEQLDVARKITSIALSTRVSALEAESSDLRAGLAEKDDLIADLQSRVESLDASLGDALDKLSRSELDKENLVKENELLAGTVKKLSRDVSKLEIFKKTLMQSLQEDEESSGPARAGAPQIIAKPTPSEDDAPLSLSLSLHTCKSTTQAQKMATKGGGDGMPGGLKYQTWTLKVPIHCEGCSRKVKRVLQGIEGVFMVNIDSQQHKVEVTGDVDSETLIKKLTKSGKQAELWPEQKEKKSGKSKNKDNKQENPKDSEDAGEEASKDVKGGESDEEEDDDGENHEPENKETGGATKEAGAAGTGGKKKKKKKKNKKKNDGGTDDGAATGNTPGTSSGFTPPMTASVSMNPYPIHYPPQAFGMNYNAAYPSPSASYYGASPMHGYSYSHPGSAYTFPPPSDPIRSYVDDDHEYDDDNIGCSIM